MVVCRSVLKGITKCERTDHKRRQQQRRGGEACWWRAVGVGRREIHWGRGCVAVQTWGQAGRDRKEPSPGSTGMRVAA